MTPLEKKSDRSNEVEAQQLLAPVWKCTFRSFGNLCPIDWSIHKEGRLVAIAEFKRRSRNLHDFQTVYLNLQKWLSLTFAGNGLEVPALFIIHCDDGIYFANLANIDPSKHRVCGRDDRSRIADMQPVISIPTTKFQKIKLI